MSACGIVFQISNLAVVILIIQTSTLNRLPLLMQGKVFSYFFTSSSLLGLIRKKLAKRGMPFAVRP